jgi:hypothetical protein
MIFKQILVQIPPGTNYAYHRNRKDIYKGN